MGQRGRERGEDRISNLPDHLLQSILHLLPLKSAVRTDLLSRRWRGLWLNVLLAATDLDFGPDFAAAESPDQFSATVDRYLRLHGDSPLRRLRILFSPFDHLLPAIDTWVAVAATKRVEEFDLDLSQGIIDGVEGDYMDGRGQYLLPAALFRCESLTHLSLSRCDFSRPAHFAVFRRLNELNLCRVNVTDEALQELLVDCPVLERLSLMNCRLLEAVRVVGEPELQLRALTLVDCPGIDELEINAPKLQSFVYSGGVCSQIDFGGLPELVDAKLSLVAGDSMEADYGDAIAQLSQVRNLSLCSGTLACIVANEEFEAEDFEVMFPNLHELQFTMKHISKEYLACVYDFFRHYPSPFLEKLFIQLPKDVHDLPEYFKLIISDIQKPPDIAFDNLMVIKMTNFQGSNNEMKLVKFLLERAAALEYLLLVSPPFDGTDCLAKQNVEIEQTNPEERMWIKIILGQISVLPKASPEVCIKLVEFWQDEDTINPTHNNNLCSRYDYQSGTVCHKVAHALFQGDIGVD
ncbi:F-box/FBD/LRR-repeat protein At1g16930-like [Zingiber officinale]|uniref:F-box domain-containing protein n=1 Tax=Zingiber officinale TaxID=94328 RepID=A0A8J5HPQ3_ZINOF|nr:F-box/FBD/LRR-repeat protein At1g16930-like [Zingiber officinale]KAG6530021.1 hypothetical protein ZIOFF_012241 [Zingiber officinale]